MNRPAKDRHKVAAGPGFYPFHAARGPHGPGGAYALSASRPTWQNLRTAGRWK